MLKARERHKAKPFRPRFSVKMLWILVTLLCAYLACWTPTSQRGVPDVVKHVFASADSEQSIASIATSRNATMIVPLIVAINEREIKIPRGDRTWGRCLLYRRYYFWFFGYVAQLPYQRTLDSSPVLTLRTHAH
jgi:hypothetical protein